MTELKKIFIASSAELKRERMELVDLMQDLNDDFEKHGIKLKPVLWEYLDSSIGEKRKEDEYLEKLRECKICFVLFWRTLGEYTEEELNEAVAEMHAGRFPKQVYVFMKEPAEGISKELILFKQAFRQNYSDISVYTFEDVETLRDVVSAIIREDK